jgi:hypothetical protein
VVDEGAVLGIVHHVPAKGEVIVVVGGDGGGGAAAAAAAVVVVVVVVVDAAVFDMIRSSNT